MAIIDKNYHKLLETILKDGFKYEDPNRKGINRIQIPNYQFKHDFKDGFPAITTKKLYWKGVVGELLWFLRGDTNIKYLVDNGINIWNKDAYNYYLKNLSLFEKEKGHKTFEEFIDIIKENSLEELKYNYSISNYTFGDLGRVYGAQWRKWKGQVNPSFKDKKGFGSVNSVFDKLNITYIDQISNLIKGLKENPMGTRHIVTAWNPAELDAMALPPCHWSFEILVEPIKQQNRLNHYIGTWKAFKSEEAIKRFLKDKDVPEYQFTLKWHQRSVDTFLGLPFNIASYALLAQIIGKMTNMIPKGIIGDLSNVHIYEPHLNAVKEQLSRDVDEYEDSELIISTLAQTYLNNDNFKHDDIMRHIDNGNINIKDFTLDNYKSYPRIPAEMLAYNK